MTSSFLAQHELLSQGLPDCSCGLCKLRHDVICGGTSELSPAEYLDIRSWRATEFHGLSKRLLGILLEPVGTSAHNKLHKKFRRKVSKNEMLWCLYDADYSIVAELCWRITLIRHIIIARHLGVA